MYEEQVINHWTEPINFNYNPFIEGNAALTINNYSMYLTLQEMNLPFDWGVLPLPSNDPQSAEISLDNIIAIHAQSKNNETTALVIEHLLSEESVRYDELSRTILSTSLLSSVNKDQEHPFHYIFERSANLAITNYPRETLLPDEIISVFLPRYRELARDIMSNDADIRESLKELEEVGNTTLLMQ